LPPAARLAKMNHTSTACFNSPTSWTPRRGGGGKTLEKLQNSPDSSLFVPQLTLSPKSGHGILVQNNFPLSRLCWVSSASKRYHRTRSKSDFGQQTHNHVQKEGLLGCSSLSIRPPGAADSPGSSGSKHASDVLRNLEMADTGRGLLLRGDSSLHTVPAKRLPALFSLSSAGLQAAIFRRGKAEQAVKSWAVVSSYPKSCFTTFSKSCQPP